MAPTDLKCPASEQVLSDQEARHRFAAVCKALAHPVRVQIVHYLMQIDRCVCGRIVELLPLAQSTVSQHLKILKASGLVRGEVEGPCTCYCLDPTVLAEFKNYIRHHFQPGFKA